MSKFQFDRKEILVLIILCLTPFIAYLNTLQNGFVWDDKYLITENPYINEIGNIPSLFISVPQESFDNKIYRPLRQAMFTLEYALWSDNALGYHLVNIVLHSINCLLVYKLLTCLSFARRFAMPAALFYSLHPLNTEVVANITGRTDILFFLFYAGGLISYIKARDTAGNSTLLLITLISYCLSLFSKEMAISFPLIVILTDIYMADSYLEKLKKNLPFYIILVLTSLAYLILRTSAISGIGEGIYQGDSLFVTMLSQSAVIWKYIKLFFMPTPLSARYDVVLIESPLNPYTISLTIAVLLLLIYTIISIRKGALPLFLFGAWWFFITLIPASNIIPIRASMMAERYTYLPSIGLCIAIFSLIKNGISVKIKTAHLFIITIPILTIFFYMTYNRNKVWKNDRTLFEDTVKKAPDSLAVHWNLFEIYRKSGEKEKAEQQYLEMKRINEDTARGLLKTALKHKGKGRIRDAERMARMALSVKPDLEDAKVFLETLSEKTGQKHKP